jgi:TolA-binding protein
MKAMGDLGDKLLELISASEPDSVLIECMRSHGTCDPADQEIVLAEAKMNHKTITELQAKLEDLQGRFDSLQDQHEKLRDEHNKLQEKHAALLAERQQDKNQAAEMRVALQNLACAPYDPLRRGFELCRILKCT